LSHLYIKMIILPRQARDKHRESTQKRVRTVFLQEEDRVRNASIIASTDCLLATLTREDFMKVHNRQELSFWINRYWELATHSLQKGDDTSRVFWDGYKKIHLLIAKSIRKKFHIKEATATAREDWVADLNRHNKGGDSLTHEQFTESLYELVDVWCGRSSVRTRVFLRCHFILK
jgi:hypothetical protein